MREAILSLGTDKLYITHSEWSSADAYSASTGSNVSSKSSSNSNYKRLPFNFCAASLQPFKNPVCTSEGIIFDLEVISQWLEKKGTNPVTGRPLKQKDLIMLKFARNGSVNSQDINTSNLTGNGDMVDPVTYKIFTDNTHIVAIRHGNEANVFAAETIQRLNIKAKMWRDLVNNKEFSRSDIITLQDPQLLDSRDLSKFKHLKEGDIVLTKDQEEERRSGNVNISALGSAGDKILRAKQALEKARKERETKVTQNSKSHLIKPTTSTLARPSMIQEKKIAPTAAQYTTGKAAASFTSTSLTPETSGERAILSEEEYFLQPKRIKNKGYARIETNLGSINIELHTDTAPRSVWNFVQLSKKDYYKGLTFHRNIPNFMIQGGDPTGTGKGGSSIWGHNFRDEFDGPLTHSSRGVVSMANKGKNTNSSQFFITYRPAKHLDRKHTIFGRVVDGFEVLDKLERVPGDKENRPLNDIVMKNIVVYVDPFEEFRIQKKQRDEEVKFKEKIISEGGTEDDKKTWTGKTINGDDSTITTAHSLEVGKYLKNAIIESKRKSESDSPEVEPVKKRVNYAGFGNFDSW